MNPLLDRRSMRQWTRVRAIVLGVCTLILAPGVRAAEGITANDAVRAPTPRMASDSNPLQAGVPACAIAGTSNCHEITAGEHRVVLSDWNMPPGGVKHADDFIPTTTAIDTICTWGTYLDPNAPSPNGCVGEVEDDFVIRIYEDNNGIPGALIAQRDNHSDDGIDILLPACELASCPGPVTVVTAATALVEPVNGNPIVAYTLTFPQIDLPVAGVPYWLEIANNTHTLAGETQPANNTCYWHISSSDPIHGDPYNGWCAVSGSNINADFTPGGRYLRLSGRWRDLLWCLGGKGDPVAVAEPATPTGACCDCDGTCQDNVTMYDCADNTPGSTRRWVQFDYGLCQDASTTCMQDRDCGPAGSSNRPCILPAKSEATCATSHVCDLPAGDTCGSPLLGTIAGSGSRNARPSDTSGSPIQLEGGHYEFDTACADTDGPNDAGSGNFLGHDLWVCYTADCSGDLTISMCASSISYGGMDSYLRIYHDFDNPYQCPCPTDSGDFLIADSNEGCNGISDGGAGQFEYFYAIPGEHYLIRMGGWGSTLETTQSGHLTLDISCIFPSCDIILPPAKLMTLDTPSGNPEVVMNRFLPIELPSRYVGDFLIRVKAVSLPGAFSVWNGQTWWAGGPHKVCEKAGQTGGTDCQAVPGQPKEPRHYNWYAPLYCDQADAAADGGFREWSGTCDGGTCSGGLEPGTACTTHDDCQLPVFLYHEGIVPSDDNGSAVYDVQTIWGDCSSLEEANFSRPLTIIQPKWGDLVGLGLSQCPRPVPDGEVGLTDVLALLQKFSNTPCQIKKARGDLRGLSSGVPDFRVDLSDINAVLGAFGVHKFPFAPLDPNDPCHLDGMANTVSIQDTFEAPPRRTADRE